MKENFKCGFICVAGLANAGKSTLVNALVGEKVSIVSWRPQTTRNKLLGIINAEDYQMILIDTPGIHEAKNKLGQYMMKSVQSGLKDVDGIVYVIDAAKGLRAEDYKFLENTAKKAPTVVALNKQDSVTRETLFPRSKSSTLLRGCARSCPYPQRRRKTLSRSWPSLRACSPRACRCIPRMSTP